MNNDEEWSLACPLCGSDWFTNVDVHGEPHPFWICDNCGNRWEMTDTDANDLLHRAFPSPGSLNEFLNALEHGFSTGTNDSNGSVR